VRAGDGIFRGRDLLTSIFSCRRVTSPGRKPMLEARLWISMLVTKLETGSSRVDRLSFFCHSRGSGNPESFSVLSGDPTRRRISNFFTGRLVR